MHSALVAFISLLAVPVSPSGTFVGGLPGPGTSGALAMPVIQGPLELPALARAVIQKERSSGEPIARVLACQSEQPSDADPCDDILRSVVRDPKVPLTARAQAAVLLGRRAADPDGQKLFADLATTTPVSQLIPLSQVLSEAPQDAAAPIALRMMKAPDDQAKIAACRVLGAIDTPEVRASLDEALAGATPQLWSAITVARARLGAPDALRVIAGAQRHMDGPDRVLAAQALTQSGDTRGNQILVMLARTKEGLLSLNAAELILEVDRPVAENAIQRALLSPDSTVKSEALRLCRLAGQPVPTNAKQMLTDPDARVRIRAAQLVVARDTGVQ